MEYEGINITEEFETYEDWAEANDIDWDCGDADYPEPNIEDYD